MKKIVYFADATCDLPASFVKQHNIQTIGLRYSIGDQEGWFTSADQAQLDEFYARMRKGDTASTSLVLYDDAAQAFEPFFKQGCDIIHFGLSSGLAKTYENALHAGIDLAAKYGCRFFAPDTKCVSAMALIALQKCFEIQSQCGKDDDAFAKIETELPLFYPTIQAYFTVEDLKYLKRSGRLSGAATFFGSLLSVKPIVTTDKDGKLATLTKKTGRLASMQFIANQTSKRNPDFPEVFIIHADCPADAKALEKKVHEVDIGAKTVILNMGFIIGTHTGPGTIGLGFVGR